MPGVRVCAACGGEVDAEARFCRHCGAPQGVEERADPVAPPAVAEEPRERPRAASGRVEQTAPGADAFAAALVAQLRTPGATAALIAGLGTAVATVIAGLLVAVATPSSSVIGGFEASILKEGMLQACALVGAALSGSGEEVDFARALGISPDIQTMPMLGLAIPIGAMALLVRSQRGRTGELPLPQRMAFALGGAIPFALLMIIPATIGEVESDNVTLAPEVGSVFGLSLVVGLIGAVLGAWGDARDAVGNAVPRGATIIRPAAHALRALVMAIGLASVVMTGLVFVQTLRDAGNAVGERSTGGAAVENSLYLVEHGIHGVELGTFAKFDLSYLARAGALLGEEEDVEDDEEATGLFLAMPVERANKLLDVDEEEATATYRLFNYSDAMPGWAFVLWIVILIPIPVVLALYAGFAMARSAGARGPAQCALWGAGAGPVWAVTLVLLNAVAKGTDLLSVFGHADGESVFGWTLLVGTVAGALGGLLVARSADAALVSPSTP